MYFLILESWYTLSDLLTLCVILIFFNFNLRVRINASLPYLHEHADATAKKVTHESNVEKDAKYHVCKLSIIFLYNILELNLRAKMWELLFIITDEL